MKNNFLGLVLFLFTITAFAQADKVEVVKDDKGMRLVVNGKDFMINGMNWDYIPIGTNTVNANFWTKSDEFIKAALDSEMSLLKNMNVNVIRQYTGVPARWIKYIYQSIQRCTCIERRWYACRWSNRFFKVSRCEHPPVSSYPMCCRV